MMGAKPEPRRPGWVSCPMTPQTPLLCRHCRPSCWCLRPRRVARRLRARRLRRLLGPSAYSVTWPVRVGTNLGMGTGLNLRPSSTPSIALILGGVPQQSDLVVFKRFHVRVVVTVMKKALQSREARCPLMWCNS